MKIIWWLQYSIFIALTLCEPPCDEICRKRNLVSLISEPEGNGCLCTEPNFDGCRVFLNPIPETDFFKVHFDFTHSNLRPELCFLPIDESTAKFLYVLHTFARKSFYNMINYLIGTLSLNSKIFVSKHVVGFPNDIEFLRNFRTTLFKQDRNWWDQVVQAGKNNERVEFEPFKQVQAVNHDILVFPSGFGLVKNNDNALSIIKGFTTAMTLAPQFIDLGPSDTIIIAEIINHDPSLVSQTFSTGLLRFLSPSLNYSLIRPIVESLLPSTITRMWDSLCLQDKEAVAQALLDGLQMKIRYWDHVWNTILAKPESFTVSQLKQMMKLPHLFPIRPLVINFLFPKVTDSEDVKVLVDRLEEPGCLEELLVFYPIYVASFVRHSYNNGFLNKYDLKLFFSGYQTQNYFEANYDQFLKQSDFKALVSQAVNDLKTSFNESNEYQWKFATAVIDYGKEWIFGNPDMFVKDLIPTFLDFRFNLNWEIQSDIVRAIISWTENLDKDLNLVTKEFNFVNLWIAFDFYYFEVGSELKTKKIPSEIFENLDQDRMFNLASRAINTLKNGFLFLQLLESPVLQASNYSYITELGFRNISYLAKPEDPASFKQDSLVQYFLLRSKWENPILLSILYQKIDEVLVAGYKSKGYFKNLLGWVNLNNQRRNCFLSETISSAEFDNLVDGVMKVFKETEKYRSVKSDTWFFLMEELMATLLEHKRTISQDILEIAKSFNSLFSKNVSILYSIPSISSRNYYSTERKASINNVTYHLFNSLNQSLTPKKQAKKIKKAFESHPFIMKEISRIVFIDLFERLALNNSSDPRISEEDLILAFNSSELLKFDLFKYCLREGYVKLASIILDKCSDEEIIQEITTITSNTPINPQLFYAYEMFFKIRNFDIIWSIARWINLSLSRIESAVLLKLWKKCSKNLYALAIISWSKDLTSFLDRISASNSLSLAWMTLFIRSSHKNPIPVLVINWLDFDSLVWSLDKLTETEAAINIDSIKQLLDSCSESFASKLEHYFSGETLKRQVIISLLGSSGFSKQEKYSFEQLLEIRSQFDSWGILAIFNAEIISAAEKFIGKNIVKINDRLSENFDESALSFPFIRHHPDKISIILQEIYRTRGKILPPGASSRLILPVSVIQVLIEEIFGTLLERKLPIDEASMRYQYSQLNKNPLPGTISRFLSDIYIFLREHKSPSPSYYEDLLRKIEKEVADSHTCTELVKILSKVVAETLSKDKENIYQLKIENLCVFGREVFRKALYIGKIGLVIHILQNCTSDFNQYLAVTKEAKISPTIFSDFENYLKLNNLKNLHKAKIIYNWMKRVLKEIDRRTLTELGWSGYDQLFDMIRDLRGSAVRLDFYETLLKQWMYMYDISEDYFEIPEKVCNLFSWEKTIPSFIDHALSQKNKPLLLQLFNTFKSYDASDKKYPALHHKITRQEEIIRFLEFPNLSDTSPIPTESLFALESRSINPLMKQIVRMTISANFMFSKPLLKLIKHSVRIPPEKRLSEEFDGKNLVFPGLRDPEILDEAINGVKNFLRYDYIDRSRGRIIMKFFDEVIGSLLERHRTLDGLAEIAAELEQSHLFKHKIVLQTTFCHLLDKSTQKVIDILKDLKPEVQTFSTVELSRFSMSHHLKYNIKESELNREFDKWHNIYSHVFDLLFSHSLEIGSVKLAAFILENIWNDKKDEIISLSQNIEVKNNFIVNLEKEINDGNWSLVRLVYLWAREVTFANSPSVLHCARNLRCPIEASSISNLVIWTGFYVVSCERFLIPAEILAGMPYKNKIYFIKSAITEFSGDKALFNYLIGFIKPEEEVLFSDSISNFEIAQIFQLLTVADASEFQLEKLLNLRVHWDKSVGRLVVLKELIRKIIRETDIDRYDFISIEERFAPDFDTSKLLFPSLRNVQDFRIVILGLSLVLKDQLNNNLVLIYFMEELIEAIVENQEPLDGLADLILLLNVEILAVGSFSFLYFCYNLKLDPKSFARMNDEAQREIRAVFAKEALLQIMWDILLKSEEKLLLPLFSDLPLDLSLDGFNISLEKANVKLSVAIFSSRKVSESENIMTFMKSKSISDEYFKNLKEQIDKSNWDAFIFAIFMTGTGNAISWKITSEILSPNSESLDSNESLIEFLKSVAAERRSFAIRTMIDNLSLVDLFPHVFRAFFGASEEAELYSIINNEENFDWKYRVSLFLMNPVHFGNFPVRMLSLAAISGDVLNFMVYFHLYCGIGRNDLLDTTRYICSKEKNQPWEIYSELRFPKEISDFVKNNSFGKEELDKTWNQIASLDRNSLIEFLASWNTYLEVSYAPTTQDLIKNLFTGASTVLEVFELFNDPLLPLISSNSAKLDLENYKKQIDFLKSMDLVEVFKSKILDLNDDDTLALKTLIVDYVLGRGYFAFYKVTTALWQEVGIPSVETMNSVITSMNIYLLKSILNHIRKFWDDLTPAELWSISAVESVFLSPNVKFEIVKLLWEFYDEKSRPEVFKKLFTMSQIHINAISCESEGNSERLKIIWFYGDSVLPHIRPSRSALKRIKGSLIYNPDKNSPDYVVPQFDILLVMASFTPPLTISRNNDEISRDNLLGSATFLLEQSFSSLPSLRFAGESGIDAGGLSREFNTKVIDLLVEKVFHRVTPTGGEDTYYFPQIQSEIQPASKALVQLAGVVFAIAVTKNAQIGGEMPPIAYDWLQDSSFVPNLDSIKQIDRITYEEYRKIKNYIQKKDNETEDTLKDEDYIEVKDMIESKMYFLMDGYAVTNSTIETYLEMKIQEYFEGFMNLRMFFRKFASYSSNLRNKIHGSSSISVDEFLSRVDFSVVEETLKNYFIKAVREMSKSELKKLLSFWTGSSRLRYGDSKYLAFAVLDVSPEKLPVAHTCFSKIDIPRYISKDKMKEKFIKASEMCGDHFLIA